MVLKYRTRKNFSYNTLYLITVMIVFILIVIALVIIIRNSIILSDRNKQQAIDYSQLITDKKYNEVIENLDLELKIAPFSLDNLVYHGISNFFKGEMESGYNEQVAYFRIALSDLRRAMALGVSDKNIYYCIGKIYFVFGVDFYNQSITYFSKSIDSGNNERADIYYYLGVIHSNTGDYQKSIGFFEKSLSLEYSDIVLYLLALNYSKMGEPDKAIAVLSGLLESDDKKVAEEANLLSGELFFNKEEYDKALVFFDSVIGLNSDNYLAYYYKGEVAYNMNDPVAARSFWRKTLEINPSHIRALSRLY